MSETERPVVLKAQSKALAQQLEMAAQGLKKSGFNETAFFCEMASSCITKLLDLIERDTDSEEVSDE